MIIWVLVELCFCAATAVGAAGPQKALLDFLLGAEHYDPDMRPVIDFSAPVNVTLQAALFQIPDLDEARQILEANIWFTFMWSDLNYTWHPRDYGGIEEMSVHPSRVWKPELVLYNSVSEKQLGSEIFADTGVVVGAAGRRRWATLAVIRASCQIHIYIFPFDTQECVLTLGSWAEDASRLLLEAASSTMDTSQYIPNSEWDLTEAAVESRLVYYNGSGLNWSQVDFVLVLRRRPLFYIVNLILPCLLLMMVGLLAFCISAQSGQKIALTTTLLLSMVLFQITISDKLPPTSEVVPLLTQFFLVAVTMLVLATTASVYVMSLADRGRHGGAAPAPAWLRRAMCGRVGALLGMHSWTAQIYKNDEQTQGSGAAGNTTLFNDVMWNTMKAHGQPKIAAKECILTEYNVWESKQNIYKADQSLEQQCHTIYIEKQRGKEVQERISQEWTAVAALVDRGFIVIFSVVCAVSCLAVFLQGIVCGKCIKM